MNYYRYKIFRLQNNNIKIIIIIKIIKEIIEIIIIIHNNNRNNNNDNSNIITWRFYLLGKKKVSYTQKQFNNRNW